MLDYLKNDNSILNKDSSNSSDETNSGENSSHQDYIVPTVSGKNIRQSTFMLAGLFLIGAACLWFMIKKTSPQNANAATDQQLEVEKAVQQLTGIKANMYSRMDEVVEKFKHLSEVKQVDVNELAKNPFMQPALAVPDEQTRFENELLERSRLEQLKIEAEQKVKDLKLWSIMESKKGRCCMINDKLFYLGDSINGFTITEIGETYVVLDYQGVSQILRIAE